jgi:tetratricopeptide (TPR) repeat protein
VLLTRLELVIRRENLRTSAITARARTHFSRQHLHDIRLAKALPSARFIRVSTRVISSLASRRYKPADLFERADQLLETSSKRLRAVHAQDLDVLTAILPLAGLPDWADTIASTGIASETAAAFLIHRGDAVIDQVPAAAESIFTATATMAAALTSSPAELVASLHGHALRGRGNARRHLAKYNDALTDLQQAATDFERARFCPIDVGRVEYSRAGILFKMERYKLALAAVRAARRHYLAGSDERLVAHADILEAGILFEQGSLVEARNVWANVERLLGVLRDHANRARVWQNLGAVETKLGNAAAARHWLRRAAAAFRRARNALELTRTRWNIASYTVAFRDVTRGIAALRAVQTTFDGLGLYADAGCVGLEIIELRLDAPHADPVLHADAQATADILLLAGLELSGAAALAALRRIALERDRPPIIADVRSALRTLDHSCPPPGRATGETEGSSGLAAPA